MINARSGAGQGPLGRAHVSTCCAFRDLVAVGGFCGELAVRRLGDADASSGSGLACTCVSVLGIVCSITALGVGTFSRASLGTTSPAGGGGAV